ncbi:hypothetical protein HUT18_11800 [Streptomyces sp. NA04227]|uniref:hypothetical protein n=1 Tax=Streptomyces sp. NA04227 TaxID=2742136 RepID=UPI0015908258|nr:hypothetical protein [Streptomyces sp. NA04227]QKW06982.1 hypothetical protein HUT18_11800 [Streptomyces sp. NA04227]
MDLRPRVLLGRLNDLADRIEPDHAPKNDDAGQPDPAPDMADTNAPDSPDTAPASADTVPDPRSGAARLPDWWSLKKPPLDAGEPPVPGTSTTKDEGGGEATATKNCDHPTPHAVHSQTTGEVVAYWCQECAMQLEAPDGSDEDEAEDGSAIPAWLRKKWRRKHTGPPRVYQRPAYLDSKPAPKQSLIQWWLGLEAPKRWALYNGTALAAGFFFGIPQYFTAETAYLVHTYGSWTDRHVCLWYGVAVGVWALDNRTRGWFPLFALAGRIPLISMVVGTLLYGSTDLEL